MSCDLCGFRPDLWVGSDVDSTLGTVPHLVEDLLRDLTEPLGAELRSLVAPLADLPREGTDPALAHTAMHALHLAGRARHRDTPPAHGTIAQVNASGGGVPKSALPTAEVSWGGLTGDRQDDRLHHGRPWQAVCLWSADVIEALQQEGHPIGFGSAGENLTLRGLDWSTLTPGLRLQAGTAVLQLTSYAIPCAKNAQWFSDGGFRRMSHQVRPAGSRLYASVVREGTVSPGDEVVVEPARSH